MRRATRVALIDGVDEVVDGELGCASGHWYPIIGGVPRLLVPELLAETFRWFHPERFKQYADRLPATPEKRLTLKEKTLQSFGFQWNVFSEMYDQWEENFLSDLAPKNWTIVNESSPAYS